MPWSLIKVAIDRHHGGPAGQRTVFRAFHDYTGASGFPELEGPLGRPAGVLLAEWAPVLYLDDRFPAAGFQLANWNLRDIAAAWANPNAELLPRVRGFQAFVDEFAVRAGSSSYHDLSGADQVALVIRVRGTTGESAPPHIQVWIVRVQ